MEQSGEIRIAASRADVWSALNDPDVLGECIKGCQNVDKIDDEHFDVTVKAKIGPVSAVFQASLQLKDLDPPTSYVIEGNAKGGAAGFAKGSASVTLIEDGEETVLRYGVKANVGGKLAQIGSRLVDGAARKMADDFFTQFCQRFEPDPATVSEQDQSENAGSGGQLKIWLIAFGVLALALLLTL